MPQQRPAIVQEKQFGGGQTELIIAGRYMGNAGVTFEDDWDFVGESSSNDGDLPGNQGKKDAWVSRYSAADNGLSYSENFGGTKGNLRHFSIHYSYFGELWFMYKACEFSHAMALMDCAIV